MRVDADMAEKKSPISYSDAKHHSLALILFIIVVALVAAVMVQNRSFALVGAPAAGGTKAYCPLSSPAQCGTPGNGEGIGSTQGIADAQAIADCEAKIRAALQVCKTSAEQYCTRNTSCTHYEFSSIDNPVACHITNSGRTSPPAGFSKTINAQNPFWAKASGTGGTITISCYNNVVSTLASS